MPAAERLDQQFRFDFHRLVPVHDSPFGKSEREVLMSNKLEGLPLVIYFINPCTERETYFILTAPTPPILCSFIIQINTRYLVPLGLEVQLEL